jgi:hypothetical protein
LVTAHQSPAADNERVVFRPQGRAQDPMNWGNGRLKAAITTWNANQQEEK